MLHFSQSEVASEVTMRERVWTDSHVLNLGLRRFSKVFAANTKLKSEPLYNILDFFGIAAQALRGVSWNHHNSYSNQHCRREVDGAAML